MKIRILMPLVVLVILGAIAWGAMRVVRVAGAPTVVELPATKVKQGRVTITVAARGELMGGNSEMLTAPMTGGGDMAITQLREPGEVIKEGDVVVQFDTTQQEFNLREAEADLAEAEQQVIQAQANSDAVNEESGFQVLSTDADVKLAELELRKNPLVPAIQARQNELALEAAKNRQRQAVQDFNNKKATSAAGIQIQRASQNKAKVMAETANKQIDSMTLKAKTSGYVNIQQNNNQNMIYWGMTLPPFQLGDTARAGMAVAQIPDLKSWEVSATIGELDRGHLSMGQKVNVAVVALAGKAFPGHVKNIGGTTGVPWDRKFECRIALDQAGPELRPGMTSNMVITLETMDDVLWVPSQALFESDGRTFVYKQSPSGFMPHDVTLVRRSESQAVIKGIKEGELVAMTNPDQQIKPAGGPAERYEGTVQMIFSPSDITQALANLRAQKTRTLLTALGIVFGVGSVIGMLAIGSGAKEESLRFIEQLGVRNVLIDSRQATSQEEFQQRRRSSPGLSERDVRILQANIEGLETMSARRVLHPARVLPKPSRDVPELYGVRPSYSVIHSLHLEEGDFFTEADDASSATVCVLGEGAKVNIFGYGPARGKFLKVNDTWMEVVGVLKEQLMAGAQNSGGAMQDINNIVYIPLNTFQYRFWDQSANMKDDLDGIEIRLGANVDSIEIAKVVTSVLNSTHHNMQDFSVTIPAALLAQQQRTQTIFTYVMVAIAAISLLVGGIGIMNIVLATVLERTREIGIRRSIGARRFDIVRQFLTESVLISVGGGLLGIGFGFFLAWLIARTAEWKTIVTSASVVIAFGVSVVVGVVFGIYPAVKASRINPIDALRYE